MAAKRKKAPKKDIREKVIETALSLAAQHGWENVSLSDIAKKSGLSLAALSDNFEDKGDILNALGRIIDRKTLANAVEVDPETSIKERIFDILMERFEILNQYRAGTISILESFKYDPKQVVIGLPYVCRSMNWMLEACAIDTSGIKGALRVTGVTAIYLKVIHVWKDDDSEDLSQTMAALDKALNQAEWLSNRLGF